MATVSTTKFMSPTTKASHLVIAVVGGRGFKDQTFIWGELDRVHRKRGIAKLVHGGTPGSEALAADWGLRVGVEVTVCEADWLRYEETAGLRRNARMLTEFKPDGVIIFPQCVFGEDMVRRAGAARIPVWCPVPRLQS